MELFFIRTNRYLVCLLLCVGGFPAQAQKPQAHEAITAESAEGDADSGEPSGDEAAMARAAHDEIRKALRGLAAEDEQQKSSGDPLLDDVLQAIRRRGSVLDGTVLDPKLADSAEPAVSEQPALPNDPAGTFRAAESLLRSARLLEALPYQDAARQQFVRRLRREASRCLRQSLSKSPAATPETR